MALERFGLSLIGVIISAILYGVNCIQTGYYYTHYTKDAWYIKLLVGLCLLADTLHQMLISHAVYTYLVTNFGNASEGGNILWTIVIQFVLNGFTLFVVQSFLAIQIWQLSNKNILITGFVMILVLVEFGCVIAYVVGIWKIQAFEQLASFEPLTVTISAIAAVVDVLITLILTILLRRCRTGSEKTNSIVNKVVLFSINTGLLTSICAVASLVSITALGSMILYMIFYFCLGRLHSNSLLVTLNTRKGKGTRSRSRARADTSSFQSPELPIQASQSPQAPFPEDDNFIEVDTTQEYVWDEDDAVKMKG